MKLKHVHTVRAIDEPLCIPLDEAIGVVEQGQMDDEVGLMRWGSNYTFLVNIEHQDARLLAIYKPRMGERPLWDFPDGTLCNRETASYLTSEALGWSMVPPTFLRDGTRGVGSVQLFIDHNPEEHYYTFDKLRVTHQLERMAIFDAIANNADRKGGHCILDDDQHLWGIDHGLTFNISEKLRTVIWIIPACLSRAISWLTCTVFARGWKMPMTTIRAGWRSFSRTRRCACCACGWSGW